MKKRAALLVLTTLLLVPAIKADGSIFTRFKLQVYEDGKPTEFYIVGHVAITRDAGGYTAAWQDIWISPVHQQKQMMLKPGYNSLQGGDLKNLSVAENRFSFELVLEQGRVITITGAKPAGSTEYRIEGAGTWWVDVLKKNLKTEWIPCDKPVVLPYAEVF